MNVDKTLSNPSWIKNVMDILKTSDMGNVILNIKNEVSQIARP